ncbi:hypothetical protein LIER_16933 [Lithospermum erythrorhizon]|uniref:Uncharacterized protein n=1 Tax=Lithospermum erythrorhizon TaxID=34254 RepID=A0AAV3QAE3_LITER
MSIEIEKFGFSRQDFHFDLINNISKNFSCIGGDIQRNFKIVTKGWRDYDIHSDKNIVIGLRGYIRTEGDEIVNKLGRIIAERCEKGAKGIVAFIAR